ncbi:hypothetical protein GCM10009743_10280 [Kribbella swartbergensis]
MPFAGQFGADLLGPVDRAAAMQHDPVTGPGERPRDRRSDTPGRTCDENTSGHRISLSPIASHSAVAAK